jgi:ubiquinone/menaquinone biosynthesis C-methylase UbiE
MGHKALSTTGQMAAESVAKGDITGWFEELYAKSVGDPSVIPWAGQKPNPYLIEWLEKNSTEGKGKPALIIGCGLGDDAEELSKRGFKVTAFDISPTAINWAKKRFPNSGVEYYVADLFDLPKGWLGAFDFVFECYTIQALPRAVRSNVITKVASVVASIGLLLIVCRGWQNDITEDTLPWALKKEELKQFMQLRFSEISFEEFWDHDDPTRYRFRILYKKK